GTLITDLETDIYALWAGLTTNVVGDTSTALSDADIRRSIEKLASLNFPLNEIAFHLHPYVYWNQVLAIQKYYDQSQFAVQKASPTMVGSLDGRPITEASGYYGQLYGIPIFVSSNVASGLQTYRNLLAHR